MNLWTEASIDFARNKNYLDELYKIYPIIPGNHRQIDPKLWQKVRKAFEDKDNVSLVSELLKLEIFPIKDSYIAFLRKDHDSISRNPNTIDRIAGNLFQLGIEDIEQKCTEPKETNRQIGPMFKNWIKKGIIGVDIYEETQQFISCKSNCILNGSDKMMQEFAWRYLGYRRDKGIDFIAKFNNKYILAETKFLTDFGGHQDAQFNDALETLNCDYSKKIVQNEVIPIAILDGVLYLDKNQKMCSYLKNNPEKLIMSALVLREYLYSC